MTCKQLSEFEKGQIGAYNEGGLLFCEIVKKLNRHRSSTDVFR